MSDIEVTTDQFDNISMDYDGGMHINDRIYIKRHFSKMEVLIENYLKTEISDKIAQDLSKVVDESNQKMMHTLDKQNLAIDEIRKLVEKINKDNIQMKSDISCMDKDIRALKNYASIKSTAIRMLIVFILSLLAFLGIHKFWL